MAIGGTNPINLGRTLYAPGVSLILQLTIPTTKMLSFIEYASEQLILKLLIKERVKIALKRKAETESISNLVREVLSMMPPRDSWVRPRRNERIINTTGEKRSTKQILAKSIALTIKKHRQNAQKHAYLTRLDSFIGNIREELTSEKKLTFNSIKIIGKSKSRKDGVEILRPLCTFNSLSEKILIALANSYLSEIFDPLLHEELLSYRPARFYHNSEQRKITTRDDAIENLQKYRQRYSRTGIYVVECDIQKYFDTINHDVIRKHFDAFAQTIMQQSGEFGYCYVRRILDAYLDSYSFYCNVVPLNEPLMRDAKHPKRYEAPKSKLFIDRGCYTDEQFNRSRKLIGIPQGGALSGLISNVILSSIDTSSILKCHDPRLYFCRYGDDILLMHTSKERCQTLIDRYCNALTENKLLYHDFVSVSGEEYMRPDGRTRPSVWSQKSRSPFLWGRSDTERDKMDWIGFLGYEIRYTGEVRLRRSSFDDKMKIIKSRYRRTAKSRLAKGEIEFWLNDQSNTYINRKNETLEEAFMHKVENFCGEGLSGAKSLNRNKYSTTQALKLNQYAARHMFKLLYKIIKRNNIPQEYIDKYWQALKTKDYIKYKKSMPRQL